MPVFTTVLTTSRKWTSHSALLYSREMVRAIFRKRQNRDKWQTQNTGDPSLRVECKRYQRAAFIYQRVVNTSWWWVFRYKLVPTCLTHKMCVWIFLLHEITRMRDVILWHHNVRGLSEARQVLNSRSSWEKTRVHLFNFIPSCLCTDHGTPCELRLSTLTWKGEWHNSGPSGHQSQRALSPFVWRGKGLLLSPSLSACISKRRENNQYYVSHPTLIDLAQCNEQTHPKEEKSTLMVRKGDKGRKHVDRSCVTRQTEIIH